MHDRVGFDDAPHLFAAFFATNDVGIAQHREMT